MGLNGIHKHAIASISNEITFLCDLYLSMSSLTMWVFDLSSSLDFLSLLFLTNYSRLYHKRYIVGTSIIENFFNVVSWSTIRKWKKVALLAVMLICSLALMNVFISLFPKDVDKINVISNTNRITYHIYRHICQISFRQMVFSYIIYICSHGRWSSWSFLPVD